jgi:hypothetical protein
LCRWLFAAFFVTVFFPADPDFPFTVFAFFFGTSHIHRRPILFPFPSAPHPSPPLPHLSPLNSYTVGDLILRFFNSTTSSTILPPSVTTLPFFDATDFSQDFSSLSKESLK